MRTFKKTIFASVIAMTATGALASPETSEVDLKDPALQEMVHLGSNKTQMNKYILITADPTPKAPVIKKKVITKK